MARSLLSVHGSALSSFTPLRTPSVATGGSGVRWEEEWRCEQSAETGTRLRQTGELASVIISLAVFRLFSFHSSRFAHPSLRRSVRHLTPALRSAASRDEWNEEPRRMCEGREVTQHPTPLVIASLTHSVPSVLWVHLPSLHSPRRARYATRMSDERPKA